MEFGKKNIKTGKDSPRWKGDNITYGALHIWLKKEKGSPQYCVINKTHKGKRYEWANISGEYRRDVNDYESLCVSCHRKKDYTEQKREKVRNFMKGNSIHNKPVKMIDPNSKKETVFISAQQAEKVTGVSHKVISNCVNGYTKIGGGYIWTFLSVR